MNTLFTITESYLKYCETQKRLDKKTLKAYRTDLDQFISFFNNTYINTISIPDIEKYIGIWIRLIIFLIMSNGWHVTVVVYKFHSEEYKIIL